MPKKRTYKTKSRTNKKSGFFTKRKIALGVALVALAGVGIVLYSNAAVGDPPVEKTLYCNQGNCFETQVPGTQRAPLKALVRETNKTACASTGKEWILKREAANKQSSQWVCLKGNASTDPPPTVPTGFGPLTTDCFDTVMLNGFTQQPNLVQVQGGPSNCLQIWSYSKTQDGNTLNGQFEAAPMLLGGANTTAEEYAASVIASAPSLNERLTSRNNLFEVDGQQSIRLQFKNDSANTTKVVIVSPRPVTINNREINGLVLTIRNFNGTTPTNRFVRDTTASILNGWQWKGGGPELSKVLSTPCYQVNVPSASILGSSASCTATGANYVNPQGSLSVSLFQGNTPMEAADNHAAFMTSRGNTIADRNNSFVMGGRSAVSYRVVFPNAEPHLMVFTDKKRPESPPGLLLAVTFDRYGSIKTTQDRVIATWQWKI